jgi:hypothetical protein
LLEYGSRPTPVLGSLLESNSSVAGVWFQSNSCFRMFVRKQLLDCWRIFPEQLMLQDYCCEATPQLPENGFRAIHDYYKATPQLPKIVPAQIGTDLSCTWLRINKISYLILSTPPFFDGSRTTALLKKNSFVKGEHMVPG